MEFWENWHTLGVSLVNQKNGHSTKKGVPFLPFRGVLESFHQVSSELKLRDYGEKHKVDF